MRKKTFRNGRLSRGLSSFDLTHNFVVSYSFELPFDALLSGHPRLTKGWVVSGINRFSTGLPVTLLESDDRALTGAFNTDFRRATSVPPQWIL